MLIRLTEVYGNGVIASNPTYTLREVFVNPEHVVMIREEVKMRPLLHQTCVLDFVIGNDFSSKTCLT